MANIFYSDGVIWGYMEISNFELEKILIEKGYGSIIGTDEVGRGPLCGPVVAAAVALKNQLLVSSFQESKEWDLVRDSKKLSEKQREEVFDFIHKHFHVGIGLCDHKTIDRINILEASFLAMKKAIQELERNVAREKPENQKLKAKSCVLVDGNKKIPNLSMEQMAVIGGDKTVKSISAASIIAKVTRDRMMADFHEKYPQYELDKHKGYGTKIHMEALLKYGPCEIHRQSFAPVKKALKRQ